jgi:hypothetical protein
MFGLGVYVVGRAELRDHCDAHRLQQLPQPLIESDHRGPFSASQDRVAEVVDRMLPQAGFAEGLLDEGLGRHQTVRQLIAIASRSLASSSVTCPAAT